MVIQRVGTNTQLNTSCSPHTGEIGRAQSEHSDRSTSSLYSISQPLQSSFSLSSFLSGAWSVVTWPFNILFGAISWLRGSNQDESTQSRARSSGGGGGGSSGGSGGSVRGGGGGKGSSGVHGHTSRHLSASPNDVQELVAQLKRIAGELNSKTFSKRVDLTPPFDKFQSQLAGLPAEARTKIERLQSALSPQRMISSDKEASSQPLREIAIRHEALARAIEILAANPFQVVADAAARKDLETMLAGFTGQIDHQTAKSFAARYDRLHSKAKQALAEVIGYTIGRPKDGEAYLKGQLGIDGRLISPDSSLLLQALKNLVACDGGRLPEEINHPLVVVDPSRTASRPLDPSRTVSRPLRSAAALDESGDHARTRTFAAAPQRRRDLNRAQFNEQLLEVMMMTVAVPIIRGGRLSILEATFVAARPVLNGHSPLLGRVNYGPTPRARPIFDTGSTSGFDANRLALLEPFIPDPTPLVRPTVDRGNMGGLDLRRLEPFFPPMNADLTSLVRPPVASQNVHGFDLARLAPPSIPRPLATVQPLQIEGADNTDAVQSDEEDYF